MAPVARSSAASAAVKAGGGDRGRHMEWAGVLHKHVKVKKDTGRRARLCDSIFHVSYDHLKNTRNPYNMLAGVIKYKVVTTGWFETLIQLTIMLVAVTTGMSLEVKDDDQDQLDLLDSLNMVTLTIFTAEVVLKLLAEGTHLWQYFTNEDRLWNVFDFSIVATSLALLGSDGGATVSVLRLLRVLRLLKFVKGIRNLYIIMIGLIAGLKSVVYIMALLLLVIYLFAVAGVLMFRENDPAHFQSTSIALLTLFRCATLAAWPEPFYVNFFGCDVYNAEIYTNGDTLEYFETQLGSFPEFTCHSPVVSKLPSLVYFFIYVILTAFVILSLFIGVITMGMFEAMNEAAKENKSEIEKARDRNAKRSEAVRANEARGALAELDKLAHIALQDLEDDYPLTDLALRVPVIAVYQNLSKSAWGIMTNPTFNNVITIAILVAGIMVGMSTDDNMFVSPWFTKFSEYTIMIMFTIEVVVKLVAEGLEPLNYFYDPWNIFDFIIVFLGIMDYIVHVGDVAIMRLLRLLRVFKLARSLPKLRSIVEAMLEGFASVSWAVILMLVSNYIFAILGVLLFCSSDPMYFGSLRNAMISIFMVVTLDNWEEMMYTNMYGCEKYGYTDLRGFSVVAYECPGANTTLADTVSADGKTEGMGWISAVYFVILVIYGGLVIPTVLIGVVAVAFEKSTKRINVERADEMQVNAIMNFARPNFPAFLTGRRVGYIFRIFKQLADVDEKQHQIFQENKQKGDPVIVSFFGMRLFLLSITEEYFNRAPLDNKQDAEEFDEWMIKLFHVSDPAHDFCNFPQFLLVLLALRDSRQEDRHQHGMDDAIVVQGGEDGGKDPFGKPTGGDNWRGNWLSDFLINIENVQMARLNEESEGKDGKDGDDRDEDTVTLVMEKEDGKRAIKGSSTGSKDNFLERKRRGSGAKSNGSNGSNGFNGSNGAAGGGEPGAWLNNNGSGPTNTGSYQREGLPRTGSRGWPSSRPSYGGDEQHAQQYASQQMQATVRQSRPAYPVTQAQLLNGDRIDDESLARVQDENEAMRTRIEQLESAIFHSSKGKGGDGDQASSSKRAASAAPRARPAGGRGGSGLRKANSSSSPGPSSRKGGSSNSDDDSGNTGNL